MSLHHVPINVEVGFVAILELPFFPSTNHYGEYKDEDVLPSLACSAVSDCFDASDYSHQAPLSMEFSRPEYWSELPFPSPFLLLIIFVSSLSSKK